jgi:hypothetical protein
MVLNDTKLILNDQGVTHAHLGPILYLSEALDVHFFTNQFLALNFFCRFLQQGDSYKW